MKISRTLNIIREHDITGNIIYVFKTDDNIGYIECYKGSLLNLLNYINNKETNSELDNLKANYILKEEKEDILDFIKSIEIIYNKDKKKFYDNYYKIKKFKTLFNNELDYCKTLYKFLKGL